MTKKRPLLTILAILAGCLLLACLGMFIISALTKTSNPPVVAEPDWDSPRTREIFMRSCGDCHSNETVWPWYTSIPPGSFLIARDVREGRENFNVSEWGRPENEGDEAAEKVKEGEMPLPIYLVLHPEARLSDAEMSEFIQGLVNTFGSEEEEEGGG